jgi:hypothetical protein
VLDTALDGHDTLLVIVIHFLVVVIIAGHCCNPLSTPLSPLLAALGGLLCALDGDAGWHHLAVAEDRFPTTWDRERSGHLLVDGVLGGDIEQLLGAPNDVVWCVKTCSCYASCTPLLNCDTPSVTIAATLFK